MKTKEYRTKKKKKNSYRTFHFPPSVCLFHLHNNKRGSVFSAMTPSTQTNDEGEERLLVGGDDGVWVCWRRGKKTSHSIFTYFHKFLLLSQQLAYIMENCENSISSSLIDRYPGPTSERGESGWGYLTRMLMLAQQSESRQTEVNLRVVKRHTVTCRIHLCATEFRTLFSTECTRRLSSSPRGGAIVNGLADSCDAEICQIKQTISPLTHQTESQPAVKKITWKCKQI